MNYKTIAITRLTVLLVLALNQTLIGFGMSPLPFDETEIEAGINGVLLTIVAIWAWYKNNNVTPEAQAAQIILDAKKERKKGSK